MNPLDPAAAFLAQRVAAGSVADHRLTVDQMRTAADRSTVDQQPELPVCAALAVAGIGRKPHGFLGDPHRYPAADRALLDVAGFLAERFRPR